MTVAVVTGAEEDASSGDTKAERTSTTDQTTTDEPSDVTTEVTGKRTYVVEPGDTLSSIADETGLSLENLQALNPKVDPQALAAGDELKLR